MEKEGKSISGRGKEERQCPREKTSISHLMLRNECLCGEACRVERVNQS